MLLETALNKAMVVLVDVTNCKLVTVNDDLNDDEVDNGSLFFKTFNYLFTLNCLDVTSLIHFSLKEFFQD